MGARQIEYKDNLTLVYLQAVIQLFFYKQILYFGRQKIFMVFLIFLFVNCEKHNKKICNVALLNVQRQLKRALAAAVAG